MAKGARASSRKNNNQKLKKNVFGPVEAARTERLSAKLLELATQKLPPKEPESSKDADMTEEATDAPADSTPTAQLEGEASTMDVDGEAKPATEKSASRARATKRRSKKSSITFVKYKDRVAKRRK